MDNIKKELMERKSEIQKELELLFKANIKITDWDIPEVNDKEVSTLLLDIMEEKLASIRTDIANGKYDYY